MVKVSIILKKKKHWRSHEDASKLENGKIAVQDLK